MPKTFCVLLAKAVPYGHNGLVVNIVMHIAIIICLRVWKKKKKKKLVNL